MFATVGTAIGYRIGCSSGFSITVFAQMMVIGDLRARRRKTNLMDAELASAPGEGDVLSLHCLARARNNARSEAPTVGYATVYPLTTLLRILSAQVLAIILFHEHAHARRSALCFQKKSHDQ